MPACRANDSSTVSAAEEVARFLPELFRQASVRPALGPYRRDEPI
jgi:hypothetical protein